MNPSDNSPKSLYDLEYLSRQEINNLVGILANKTRVLILPSHAEVQRAFTEISAAAEDRQFSVGMLLYAYQRLKDAEAHTDIICGWDDNHGKKCAGLCDIEITPLGAYYQCRVDTQHRTAVG